VNGAEMSIRDELRKLVDKYHDAISCTDFSGECSLSESSIDPLEEEYKIRKQLFDKIDEVVDVNEPKWIPIEQQKPPEHDWYFVFFPANKEHGTIDYVDVCFWDGTSFVDSGIGYKEDGIGYTHWMPFPEPPKGE